MGHKSYTRLYFVKNCQYNLIYQPFTLGNLNKRKGTTQNKLNNKIKWNLCVALKFSEFIFPIENFEII